MRPIVRFVPARLAGLALAASLAAGALLLAITGPAPQYMYAPDTAAYLDACQRVSLGQRLALDFTTPIGPAAVLPTALAMRLTGANVHALVGGSVLVWLCFGTLAWCIAQPRLAPALGVGFALFTAGTAAAPYTLDFGSWRALSYAMQYNRLAWAALGLATVAVLLPRRDATPASVVPAGLGACAVWLWAIKPNYLLILLPLVVYHGLAARCGLAQWLGRAIAGASVMLAFLWLCVPFSPTGLVATHLGMAQEAPLPLLQETLIRTLRENAVLVLGLAVLWWLALQGSESPARPRIGLALTVLAMTAATFMANLTNCQYSEIPLWGALAWVTAALAGSRPRLVGLAAAAMGLAFTWQPLASIAYAAAWKRYQAPGHPPAVQVSSPAWQGLPMRPAVNEAANAAGALESAGNYAVWLNDGLALLRTGGLEAKIILCLDWTNPFPFATGTTPAVGDDIAWHVGRTIGPKHHPDVMRLLSAADIVMEPRRSLQPESLAFKRALFRTDLERDFEPVAESAQWRVWRRKTSAGAS